MKNKLWQSLTQPTQIQNKIVTGGVLEILGNKNSLSWWDVTEYQEMVEVGADVQTTSHDERPKCFFPHPTRPLHYISSIMDAYWIPDNTVSMSLEDNYISNVLLLPSAPGGENPSVALWDYMEKSFFVEPRNTTTQPFTLLPWYVKQLSVLH